MKDLLNYTLKELEDKMMTEGFKKFNARQIYQWTYKKKETDFTNMSNLSKNLRAYLKEKFVINTLTLKIRQLSNDGTEKFLFELEDGNIIETVLMRHDYGLSVCVTTQLGCNMGCSFCASGLYKKTRDLTTSEIVSQVYTIEQLIKERVSHVVVMGIGEPFDNYDNTMRFLKIINSPHGQEIGARHMTVSTSGLPKQIRAFANEDFQVNLAISLHAPNNKLRTKLMKINETYPIEEVLDAVKYYIDKTNRRVTFEYILLKGVNDDKSLANELSDLLRGINCYVNLIRYNSVKEFDYEGTEDDTANTFKDQLLKRGINATLRQEKGSDIDAACGQLRSKELD
ncbi:MAG: 23S rRNA (adenine(2503)-C(2))-methyltransferase RlmN [Candidatus Izimaplasma sp.]|nr:23S rRNA (adenine(2503)-C(2))-methyltransferase RlmN [Candidatus Izimaplasma bacterium]